MGTKCTPLLAYWLLYSYEAEFVQKLLKCKTKTDLANSFNFTFRILMTCCLSIFPIAVSVFHQIYPHELEIKDTTETRRSASYMDLLLEINSDGILKSRISDKRDDFSFPIANFPFLSRTYHHPQLMAYMYLK